MLKWLVTVPIISEIVKFDHFSTYISDSVEKGYQNNPWIYKIAYVRRDGYWDAGMTLNLGRVSDTDIFVFIGMGLFLCE